VTVLVETRSRWGVSYIARYFINGRRVSNHEYSRQWLAHGCTPDNGEPMENTSYGFRKTWKRETVNVD
jgi:hypothetical protein